MRSEFSYSRSEQSLLGKRGSRACEKGSLGLTDMFEFCGNVINMQIEAIHCIVHWSFQKASGKFACSGLWSCKRDFDVKCWMYMCTWRTCPSQGTLETCRLYTASYGIFQLMPA